MPHALRKSTGPFSAGTRVIIVSGPNSDKTYTVEIPLKPNQNFDYDDLIFDVDSNELVELRSHVDVVPKLNRRSRRDVNLIVDHTVDELFRISNRLP